MANELLRETILESLKEKLEAIMVGEDFFYRGRLKSVQRYIHRWDGTTHETNSRLLAPTILIKPLAERSVSDQEVGTWTRELDVELHFILRGESADDSDINQALADMERALFKPPMDGFAARSTQPSYSTRLFDEETGMPLDGVVLSLTLTYSELIGEPGTLG